MSAENQSREELEYIVEGNMRWLNEPRSPIPDESDFWMDYDALCLHTQNYERAA